MAYPTAVPISEVKRVLSAIRSGKPADNAPQFVSDLWNVAGYLAGITLGEPDGPQPLFATLAPAKLLTKADGIKALEAMAKDAESGNDKQESFGALPFDYKSLLKWLLSYLLENVLK